MENQLHCSEHQGKLECISIAGDGGNWRPVDNGERRRENEAKGFKGGNVSWYEQAENLGGLHK